MHPNSLQDYIIENTNISGKMVKAQVQSGATAQEAMQPSRAEKPSLGHLGKSD